MVSTHLENISQNWIISPGRDENKKYLKPPTSGHNSRRLFSASAFFHFSAVEVFVSQSVVSSIPLSMRFCLKSVFPQFVLLLLVGCGFHHAGRNFVILGSSKNSSFWGIQEIFCLAVRTNQAPGTFLVGTTSPNVKPVVRCPGLPKSDFSLAWVRADKEDLFVRTDLSKWRMDLSSWASWDETGWWDWSGWGTLLEDGELYWFRLVAGCGRIYFGEAILDQFG